eukprot:4580382-Prymnesium_polylepis.1
MPSCPPDRPGTPSRDRHGRGARRVGSTRWARKSALARMKSRHLVQHLHCAAWPVDALPTASSRTS